jgi:hypothetical protein
MDCRTFRDNHAQFVDGLAADAELVMMQRHVAECIECAAHDATIRRALLLFRNMPSIEPSPEFAARLEARLRAERKEQRARAQTAGYGGHGARRFAAAGAALLAAGLAVFAVLGVGAHVTAPMSTTMSVSALSAAPLLTLSPVVVAAAAPRIRPERIRTIVGAGSRMLVRDSGVPGPDATDPWSSFTDPAFAASVSAGMPVWPAAALAAHPPTSLGSPIKLTNLER